MCSSVQAVKKQHVMDTLCIHMLECLAFIWSGF